MKHNISITMDQKLFREVETIRGREKRSTFIEHLIIEGLKKYSTQNNQITGPIIFRDLKKEKKSG